MIDLIPGARQSRGLWMFAWRKEWIEGSMGGETGGLRDKDRLGR